MKSQSLKTTALISMMALSTSAFSSDAIKAKISDLIISPIDSVSTTASITVKFSSLAGNPSTCDGLAEYKLDRNSAFFDEVYSLLLSAKISGKTVSFEPIGRYPECTFSYIGLLSNSDD